MTKVSEKWVNFGVGAGQVSSKSLPSAYTPDNYIPVAVGAEAVDRLSAHLKGIDSKLGNLSGGGVIAVETFDIGPGGVSIITLSTDINSTQALDVFLNGIKQREGGGNAYARNQTTNQITFSEIIPAYTWVEVKVFETAINDYNFTVGGGGQTSFSVNNMSAGNTVDVILQGVKQREGAIHSWVRDVNTQTIGFTENVPEGYWVQIRIQ